MTLPLVAQAQAVRETVLVVPGDDRDVIMVTGTDRTTWLNGLVTCDLAALRPGDAAYGLLVEKKGKIQADLLVLPGVDALALGVPRERADVVAATLEHYLIMEDAEIERANLQVFFAHGPRAHELLARVAPAYGGKLDWLGRGGAVLGVSGGSDACAQLERAASELGGGLADEAGWEAIRVEHGLPRFGREFDTSHYPQEAALEELAVSFSKGCYLGQEVVYMLQHRGHVQRKLVTVDVEGDSPVPRGAPVTLGGADANGQALGEVRSSVVGPASGRVVAIAMVKWAQAKGGTELLVDGRPARVRASDRA